MSRAVLVVTIIIALGTLAGGTWAQHHGAHGSSPGADLPPHRQMQAALDEIDRVIAQGLGAGMAFAASVFEMRRRGCGSSSRTASRTRGGSAWPWRRWSVPARSSGSCIS
jgi:hypothetical protein